MKNKFNINNKENGFTLIELLAVIIILGVLMLIAIPSVTEYIATSRKKTYVATANRYVDAAMLKVNSLEYPFTDMDTTYYIPVECINLEKGGKSPYGTWKDAYVAVEFTGETYNYYWISVDNANMGVNLTAINDLSIDNVVSNVTSIEMKAINSATKTATIDKANCSVDSIVTKIPEGGSTPVESTSEKCFAFTPSTGTITKYYAYVDNNSANGVCPKDVIIPSKINGVAVEELATATASTGVFVGRNITSVILPNTLKKIGDYAFYQNKLMGSLVIPNGVTSIGEGAFYANQLTSVIIPDSVTYIYGPSISVSSTSGTYAYMGSGAFARNKLASVTLGNGLIEIGNVAFGENLLTTIVIPNNVTSVGHLAFDSNKLVSLTIGNRVTSIGGLAFKSNELSSVVIPDSVTTIGALAFYRNKLTNLTLGNGVATIDGYAFQNNKLANVVIPSSVTTIRQCAFVNNELVSVTIKGKTNSGQFTTYGASIWGWDDEASSSIIIWNA